MRVVADGGSERSCDGRPGGGDGRPELLRGWRGVHCDVEAGHDVRGAGEKSRQDAVQCKHEDYLD